MIELTDEDRAVIRAATREQDYRLACESAYLAGLAAGAKRERERCAVKAWSEGMDLHNRRTGLPYDCREVGSIIAAAIRALAGDNPPK